MRTNPKVNFTFGLVSFIKRNGGVNMKQLKKRFGIFFMMLSMIFMVAVTPISAQVSTDEAYKTASQYMVKAVPNPTFGDEWFIISLARGEYSVPANYYETYYKNLVQEVKKLEGNLHNRKYTEYSRVILALSAIGKDATNVGGYNLVEELYDFDKVVWQGLNGPIFALIALDSWNYDLPKTAKNSRDKMIEHILSKQLTDGGFALSGTKADPDMTGMAVQALSTYKNRTAVQTAINKALDALVKLQGQDGSYQSWGTTNSESAVQVITALTSLSIDPNKDLRFNNVFTSLFSFYHAADGGFKHVLTQTVADGMATEQAGYGLASYKRLLAGQTKLYDMSDTKKQPTPTEEKPVEPLKPTEHASTKASFTDTTSHWAKSDIEKAFEKGLLKGYADGTFKPNKQLTRVQAVSILVRALGLENRGAAPFTDITAYEQATKNEIAAAHEANILVMTSGKFAPSAKISREELAIMLARAYKVKTNESYSVKIIAPFTDIKKLSPEAQQAITFLYDFEIAQGSNGVFNPSGTTTRAHAAKMFVNFLGVVE